MNRKLFIALTLVVVIVIACNKEKTDITPAAGSTEQAHISTSANSSLKHHHSSHKEGDSTNAYSSFITTDVANQMISSYLYSIGGQNNSNNGGGLPTGGGTGINTIPVGSPGSINDLKSFSIDADSLRAYLATGNIKSVKLIFAHTMDYVNDGNMGIFSGMQSGAMTIIVACYDANGNYVYYSPGGANSGQYVLDHCMPCPENCPNGNAGGDLLQ